MRSCPSCNGTGQQVFLERSRCRRCFGQGRATVLEHGKRIDRPCSACDGAGYVNSRRSGSCTTCGGRGTIN